MWEKKDQLEAHLFLVGRLVKALVAADPDLRRSPTRRATVGWVVGAVVAALIAGGFLVFGLFTGGDGNSWKVPGTVVVEEETGARFVYLGDRLHPVLNRTSLQLARAALGTATDLGPPSVVPTERLAGVPRTAPMGIPGAPESLPTPGGLVAGPWSLCSTDSGPDGLELSVPARAPGRPLRAGEALLVRSESGTSLLWNGFRYAVDEVTLTALGVGGVDPIPVQGAFVKPLPAGAPLVAWRVAGAGDPGPVVDGQRLRVGQVVRTTGGAPEFFVAGPEGLRPITETAGMLLLAGPDAAAAYAGEVPGPREVSPAGAATALAPAMAPARSWPATPPVLVRPEGGSSRPCTQLTPGPDGTTGAAFGLAEPRPAGRDHVAVAPGRGALVRPAGAAPGSPMMIIADDGRAYPLDEDARRALGYDDRQVRPIPDGLIGDVVPVGPALTVRAAVQSMS